MAQAELLISGPGTGKTSRCLELFKESVLRSRGGIDSRSYFILPSREHADRIKNLILKGNVPGLFNAHIITINDLASRLLGALGTPWPSDLARGERIRQILERPDLSFVYFDKILDAPGFRRLLVDVIKEFKSSLLSLRDFEKAAQPLLKDEAFRMKFRDLCVLLKNYDSSLEEANLREPEDDIGSLLQRVDSIPDMELVIFDGFYHFSRAQRALLAAVARRAERTVVTLTMDTRGRDGLFAFPRKTAGFLERSGFRIVRKRQLVQHRTSDEALRHLEQNVFSEKPAGFRGDSKNIRILEAPDARTEIRLVARQIKRLYRESAAHYSDFCVIVRHVGSYEKLIEAVFDDYGIPVLVHERKKMIENAIMRFLRRLCAVFADDWKPEDVFALLGSSLPTGLSAEEVSALEAAAQAENLSAGRTSWEALSKNPSTGEPARRALAVLFEYENELLGAPSAQAACIRTKALAQKLAGASPDRDFSAALRALDRLLTHLRGGREGPFSAAYFFDRLAEGLEGALYSVKIPDRNRVQVYDIVMALPKEYKNVFMVGLLEDHFPALIQEDPLLKDAERRVLNREDVFFEERAERRNGERYFFYMALTRAKERLFLSYPLFDDQGRPTLPSFYITEARKCFSEIATQRWADQIEDPDECETAQEADAGVLNALFSDLSRKWMSQWASIARDRIQKQPLKSAVTSVKGPSEASLSTVEAKRFFRSIRGPFSATQLETFSICAFRYFAGKVLRLNEPSEGHDEREMGRLLHKALERYYFGLPARDRESGSFLKNLEAMKQGLTRILEEKMQKSHLQKIGMYRRRVYFESMRKTLEQFADDEKAYFERRDLVPTHFEFDFGRDPKGVPAYRVRAGSETIELRGQIDRIDVDRDGRALVIDYKRSARELSLKDKLATGLEFQLPIYLLAVRDLLRLRPIGAELRVLRGAHLEKLYSEEARDVLGLDQRTQCRSVEEFERILNGTPSHIAETVRRLQSGDIRVRPRSCAYCSFAPVCRFESWKIAYLDHENKKN